MERESSPHFQQPGDEWKVDAHTVDLEDCLVNVPGVGIQVNGGCGCSDFTYNRHKVVTTQRKISRCKHIKAAMYHIMSDLILETQRLERNRNRSRMIDGIMNNCQ